MRARNHLDDVPSWLGVVELSGKKPWIVKIGAIPTELCAREDAPNCACCAGAFQSFFYISTQYGAKFCGQGGVARKPPVLRKNAG